jgi:hypothetical protein
MHLHMCVRAVQTMRQSCTKKRRYVYVDAGVKGDLLAEGWAPRHDMWVGARAGVIMPPHPTGADQDTPLLLGL